MEDVLSKEEVRNALMRAGGWRLRQLAFEEYTLEGLLEILEQLTPIRAHTHGSCHIHLITTQYEQELITFISKWFHGYFRVIENPKNFIMNNEHCKH